MLLDQAELTELLVQTSSDQISSGILSSSQKSAELELIIYLVRQTTFI